MVSFSRKRRWQLFVMLPLMFLLALLGSGTTHADVIDNGKSSDSEGYISLDVDDAGDSDAFRVTIKGKTELHKEIDILYALSTYVSINGRGGVLLQDTTTSEADEVETNKVESRGSFDGPNGAKIDWKSTTWIVSGQRGFSQTFEFSSSKTFGDVRIIHYLDEDIISTSDNVLAVSGDPGGGDFRLMTLHNTEEIGFAHSAFTVGNNVIQNASYLGWAAAEYSTLEDAITSNGGSYSINGNINEEELPFNRASNQFGNIYGPEDLASALAWQLDSNKKTAKVTASLGTVNIKTVLNELASFKIDHDKKGVYYCPETITITALTQQGQQYKDYSGKIDLSTNIKKGRWQKLDGKGSLTNIDNAGNATYKFSPKDKGKVKLSLVYKGHNTSNSLNIDVKDSKARKKDNNREGNIVYSPLGFSFKNVHTKNAGGTTQIDITALNANTENNSCTVAKKYNGEKSLMFWQDWINPTRQNRGLVINDTELLRNGEKTPIDVSFEQGIASISLRYPDVGLVAFSAEDANQADISGRSNDFKVVPHSIRLKIPSSTKLIAGKSFSLEVQALSRTGAITRNFGRDDKDFHVTTTYQVLSPDNPERGVLESRFKRRSGKILGDVSFNEVGSVNIVAKLTKYLGDSINRQTSATLPDFIPSHFTASLQQGKFSGACTDEFSYLGQAFGFSEKPRLTVTAKNQDNETTKNYRDEHMRLTNRSLVLRPSLHDRVAKDRVGDPLPVLSFGFDTPARTQLGAGIFQYEISGQHQFLHNDLNNEVKPFKANLPIVIDTFKDRDGVTIAGDMPNSFTPEGTEIRFGRVRSESARSIWRVPTALRVKAEYFSDEQRYIRSIDDTCTEIKLENIEDMDANDQLNFAQQTQWRDGIRPEYGTNTGFESQHNGLIEYLLPQLQTETATAVARITFSVPSHLQYPWRSHSEFVNPQSQLLYRSLSAHWDKNIIGISEIH